MGYNIITHAEDPDGIISQVVMTHALQKVGLVLVGSDFI